MSSPKIPAATDRWQMTLARTSMSSIQFTSRTCKVARNSGTSVLENQEHTEQTTAETNDKQSNVPHLVPFLHDQSPSRSGSGERASFGGATLKPQTPGEHLLFFIPKIHSHLSF